MAKTTSSGGGSPVVASGSWWGLDTVFKQSRQEFDAFVSRPPMACPNCGEPLTYAPATNAGSGVERYCRYDGWQFPRDWTPPSRPMPWLPETTSSICTGRLLGGHPACPVTCALRVPACQEMPPQAYQCRILPGQTRYRPHISSPAAPLALPRGREPAAHRHGCAAPVKAHTAKGHTKKHARAAKTKHHATAKHHPAHTAKAATKHKHVVHAKAKHATHAKAKGLTFAGDVACCTIEALAASLLSQGLSVTDAEVLELFQFAGGDEDKGMPVRAAFEAASEHGLAGVRLAGFAPASLDATLDVPLILGVELPGQHTVLATPDGWWSWGELYCPWCEFPDAVIDEAWAVEWTAAA